MRYLESELKSNLTIAFLLIFGLCQAQLPDIVSVRHKDKIERTNSAKKKLKKYRKYYSKDSTSHFEAVAESYGVKLDSADNKAILPEEISVAGYSVNRKDSAFVQNNLGKYFPEQFAYYSEYQQTKNTFTLDSADRAEIENTKESSKRKALYKEHQKAFLASKGYNMDSLDLVMDSLKVVVIQDSLKAVAYGQAEDYRKETALKAEGRGMDMASDYVDVGTLGQDAALAQENLRGHEKYKKKYGKYTSMNKDTLQNEAREYLKTNPYVINEAQKEDRALKAKYSKVSNSNDLTSAQKSNSLKGKSFADRLWLGGNFQLDRVEPYAIYVDPAIGYYLNRDLLIGIGMKFSYELGDYDRSSQRYDNKRSDFGYLGFMDYTLYKGFYLTGQLENMKILYVDGSDQSSHDWVMAALLGVGKIFNISHGFKMRAAVYYNFMYDATKSQYNSPWVFRIGFALPKVGKVLK